MGFRSTNAGFSRSFNAHANFRSNAKKFSANNGDISPSGEVSDFSDLRPFNFLPGKGNTPTPKPPVQSPQMPGVMDVVHIMLQMIQLILEMNGGNNASPTLPDTIPTPGTLPAWQSSPQALEMDLGNPVDLKGRQIELMGGLSKEFDTLINTIDQSAAGSDARKTAEATLASRWTQLQGDPKTLQEFAILQGLKDQHAVITDLIAQGKKSTDPEYRAANVTKKGLYQQFGALHAPSQSSLPTVDFASASSISARQQELLGSSDAQLKQMITQLNTLNPESALAEEFTNGIATRALELDSSPASQVKINEFTSLQALKQLNSVGTALGSVAQAYPPTSPAYQLIQTRMTTLNQQRETLIGNIRTLQGYKPASGVDALL